MRSSRSGSLHRTHVEGGSGPSQWDPPCRHGGVHDKPSQTHMPPQAEGLPELPSRRAGKSPAPPAPRWRQAGQAHAVQVQAGEVGQRAAGQLWQLGPGAVGRVSIVHRPLHLRIRGGQQEMEGAAKGKQPSNAGSRARRAGAEDWPLAHRPTHNSIHLRPAPNRTLMCRLVSVGRASSWGGGCRALCSLSS